MIEYALPRTPIKDTDKRKSKFELRFGVGATELDALEALYPGELRTILSGELGRYYDTNLTYEVNRHSDQIERLLDETSERVYARHEEEISALESEWQAIRVEFEKRIVAHSAKRDDVWHAIRDELEQEKPSIDEDDVPEAKYAEERDGALLDSSRDYLAQNDIYQAHKGNESDEEE